MRLQSNPLVGNVPTRVVVGPHPAQLVRDLSALSNRVPRVLVVGRRNLVVVPHRSRLPGPLLGVVQTLRLLVLTGSHLGPTLVGVQWLEVLPEVGSIDAGLVVVDGRTVLLGVDPTGRSSSFLVG